MKIINIVTIFLQNVICILSSLCNNTEYWCHKSGIGMKYLDSSFTIWNHTDYKNCVEFCQENIQCKAFEYNVIEKTCRFSPRWCRILDQMDSNKADVFWKRSPQMSCSHELNEGECSKCGQYVK